MAAVQARSMTGTLIIFSAVVLATGRCSAKRDSPMTSIMDS